MTSKGLFFKYMRENTKQRLWSVALTALLCFFLFPVLTALETSIMLRPDNLSKDLSVEAALAEAKLKLTNEMLHMYSIDLRVFIQTADAGGGRSTARHTAYDYNFHLAPSTIAAISDLGR